MAFGADRTCGSLQRETIIKSKMLIFSEREPSGFTAGAMAVGLVFVTTISPQHPTSAAQGEAVLAAPNEAGHRVISPNKMLLYY